MSQLDAYCDKRNLDTSREPAGKAAGSASGRVYVMHKHDASQLHYDLRLEQDGVLRSWAVPKGQSLQVGVKRLAIEVDDHPLEYGDFEGVIAQDAYSGGTVMVWNRGEWEQTGNNEADQIDFALHGEKLSGAWTLVRMADQESNENKNWLLIKRHDRKQRDSDAKMPQALDDQSVLSGRSMARIAADDGDDANMSERCDG